MAPPIQTAPHTPTAPPAPAVFHTPTAPPAPNVPPAPSPAPTPTMRPPPVNSTRRTARHHDEQDDDEEIIDGADDLPTEIVLPNPQTVGTGRNQRVTGVRAAGTRHSDSEIHNPDSVSLRSHTSTLSGQRSNATSRYSSYEYHQVPNTAAYPFEDFLHSRIQEYGANLTCGGQLRRHNRHRRGDRQLGVVKYTCSCSGNFRLRVREETAVTNSEGLTQGRFVVEVPSNGENRHQDGTTFSALDLRESPTSAHFGTKNAKMPPHLCIKIQELIKDEVRNNRELKATNIAHRFLETERDNPYFRDIDTRSTKDKLLRAIRNQMKNTSEARETAGNTTLEVGLSVMDLVESCHIDTAIRPDTNLPVAASQAGEPFKSCQELREALFQDNIRDNDILTVDVRQVPSAAAHIWRSESLGNCVIGVTIPYLWHLYEYCRDDVDKVILADGCFKYLRNSWPICAIGTHRVGPSIKYGVSKSKVVRSYRHLLWVMHPSEGTLSTKIGMLALKYLANHLFGRQFGVDVFISDGAKGLRAGVREVFPAAKQLLCYAHISRAHNENDAWKRRITGGPTAPKVVGGLIQCLYHTRTEAMKPAAFLALKEDLVAKGQQQFATFFERTYGCNSDAAGNFLSFSSGIPGVIPSNNTIESLFAHNRGSGNTRLMATVIPDSQRFTPNAIKTLARKWTDFDVEQERIGVRVTAEIAAKTYCAESIAIAALMDNSVDLEHIRSYEDNGIVKVYLVNGPGYIGTPITASRKDRYNGLTERGVWPFTGQIKRMSRIAQSFCTVRFKAASGSQDAPTVTCCCPLFFKYLECSGTIQVKRENNVELPFEGHLMHSVLTTHGQGTRRTQRKLSEQSTQCAADFGLTERTMSGSLLFLFGLGKTVLEEVCKFRSMSNYRGISQTLLSDYSRKTGHLFRILVGTCCGTLVEEILRNQQPPVVTRLSSELATKNAARLAQYRATNHCDWIGAEPVPARDSRGPTNQRATLPSQRGRTRPSELQHEQHQQRQVRQRTRQDQPNTDTLGDASLPRGNSGGRSGRHDNLNLTDDDTDDDLDGFPSFLDDGDTPVEDTVAAPARTPASVAVLATQASTQTRAAASPAPPPAPPQTRAAASVASTRELAASAASARAMAASASGTATEGEPAPEASSSSASSAPTASAARQQQLSALVASSEGTTPTQPATARPVPARPSNPSLNVARMPAPLAPSNTRNNDQDVDSASAQSAAGSMANHAVSILPHGRLPKQQNKNEPWQYVAEDKGLGCAAHVLSQIQQQGPFPNSDSNNSATIVHACMVHASDCDRCILEMYSFRRVSRLLPSDVVRLDGQGWLNDTIISTSIDLVSKYYARNTDRVNFVSVYWFTGMFKRDANASHLQLNRRTFKAGGGGKPTPTNRSSRPSLQTSYDAHPLMFIPVNEPGKHWLWILVIKETRTILVCDPLGSHTEERNAELVFYAECVDTRLRREMKRSHPSTYTGRDIESVPKFHIKNLFHGHKFQTDGASCGIFLIWAAWAVAKHRGSLQGLAEKHLADIQAASISHQPALANSHLPTDSIVFFRLWLCISILQNKLWIPDESPSAQRVDNWSREKDMSCTMCCEKMPQSEWKKFQPVSFGCEHYGCRRCVTRLHARPMVGGSPRLEMKPCGPCPHCRTLNIWRDVLTNTPYPPNRWYGFVLMGTARRRCLTRNPNPFYKPISDLEEWNREARDNNEPQWVIPTPSSGTPARPVVVDEDTTEHLPDEVDRNCVWCDMPGNLKNTVCGHYGCDRCYRNLVNRCRLKWKPAEIDVRLVRVGECSLCQKHPGCWAYVDGAGTPRAPPQPVYGYLRTHVGTTMSHTGTLKTKPILLESDWNQLCLHFGLHHWMSKDTEWNRDAQARAIQIDGVPTNPQDLERPTAGASTPNRRNRERRTTLARATRNRPSFLDSDSSDSTD